MSPNGFSWVVPDVLAAMSRPYDAVGTMEFLRDEGVSAIISLTEHPLNRTVVDEFGFDYHHIPVQDFTAPTARQIDKFVSIVENVRQAGGKSVVHCLAGRGRTGTMLACYLVFRGRTADEAVEEVRQARPGSVETPEQTEAVRRYARRLLHKKRRKR